MNRALVLTLRAAVVAERLGFDRAAALTLGRAVAGSSAQMKGRAFGIYEPSHEPPSKAAEERREKLDPEDWVGVRLLGRLVPAVRTPEGIRALEKDFRPASACMRRSGLPCRPGLAAGAQPVNSTWTGLWAS